MPPEMPDRRAHDHLRNRLATCECKDLERISLLADLNRSTLRGFLSGDELNREAVDRLVAAIDATTAGEADASSAALSPRR